MERKQFGSVFIGFALVLVLLSSFTVLFNTDLNVLGLISGIYAGSLMLSGIMVMLFASNDEVEISNITIIVMAGIGFIVGILTQLGWLTVINFTLIGLSMGPIVTFIREF